MTITDELPNYFLDYREHLSNDTRWTDRVCSGDGTWSGNIFDFYYKVIDRLTADVKKPFRIDSSLMRIDDTPIHKSLRECLANALIHADFYGRRGIVIDKEFRKIVIANPGTFRISIEEAIGGGISDARNGRIFNMFALISVGERSGTGICDVYHVWDENGFKKPSFAETVDPDRVTLTLEIDTDGNIDGNDGNIDGNDGSLTQNEILVLQVLSRTPALSAAKIGAEIGISKPSKASRSGCYTMSWTAASSWWPMTLNIISPHVHSATVLARSHTHS